MSKTDKKLYLVLLFIATIFILFFGYRKMDYNVDEVWTFGLANHTGSIYPDVEYGKTYTGEGLFKDFMQVSPDNTFNYGNVMENQANDVHPPLYYFLIHTVCSIFKDSYSMWYGISVNIFWMVLIIFLLYKLIKELTSDTYKTFTLMLFYITSMAFMDTILLIRMYAQFTFFTIALSYLLFKYWSKQLDRKFYILYSIIIICGMLSHYYFLIFTFFISAAFGVHLILYKRNVELKNCVITAAVAGVVYLILWYHIASHIFRGGRGKQALHSAASIDITTIVFAIIGTVALVYIFKRGKDKYNYISALYISGLLYTLVVLKVAPFINFRYLMAVSFIGFYFIYSVLYSLVQKRTDRKSSIHALVIILLLINIVSFGVLRFHTSTDFYYPQYAKLLSDIEGKDYIIYIEEDWEALYYFVPSQRAHSYTFVNPDTIDMLDDIEEGYIFSTRYEHLDKVENLIKGKPLYNVKYALQYFEITN